MEQVGTGLIVTGLIILILIGVYSIVRSIKLFFEDGRPIEILALMAFILIVVGFVISMFPN